MTDEERAFNDYCYRYSSLCGAIGLIRSNYSKEEKIAILREEEPSVFEFLFPTQAHIDAFLRLAKFEDKE